MKNPHKAFKWDLFVYPERYAELIDAELIVADTKVCCEGVERYKIMIESGEDVGTLVIIKHPKENLYTVLDGHHKYWAQKEKEIKKMKCAVVPDFVGLLFFLTKEGLLQPTPVFTQYVRVPFNKAKNYLEQFLYEPEKLKEKSI